MDRTLLIRAGGLYIPVVAAVAASLWRKPQRPVGAGILLASLWSAETLLALNILAIRRGWWNFRRVAERFFTSRLICCLDGWCSGEFFPYSFFRDYGIGLVVLLFLSLDLACMPRLAPVLTLGPGWLWGETFGLLICLVPSLVLARWTRDATHLYARVCLQVLIFSGLILGLLPSAILSLDRRDMGTCGFTSHLEKWVVLAAPRGSRSPRPRRGL